MNKLDGVRGRLVKFALLLGFAAVVAGGIIAVKFPAIFYFGRVIRFPGQVGYWQSNGFAEMVGALRLPTNSARTEKIQVWLKVPDGSKIKARKVNGPKGDRITLEYPPGTVADRINFLQGRSLVGDVRGARINENGEMIYHVYGKAKKGDSFLSGYEWARKDDRADVVAGDALVRLLFKHGDSPYAKAFLVDSHCSACHEANSAAPMHMSDGLVRYETDAAGFFQVLTVVSDEETVRGHRDWDLNADDPFVSVWCGKKRALAMIKEGRRFYECPGGFPVGRLNLVAALKAGDSHALGLCRSRRYIFEHMDEESRILLASAFAECGLH
jgi:hypothetical protein